MSMSMSMSIPMTNIFSEWTMLQSNNGNQQYPIVQQRSANINDVATRHWYRGKTTMSSNSITSFDIVTSYTSVYN